MFSVDRLQAYLRRTAQSQYQVVPAPPFTLFFHPSDSLTFFNYAIPDEPVGSDLAEPLTKLKAEFQVRNRMPRFEFIEGYAPELAEALRSNGFEEESRLQLMVCPYDSYQPAPKVPGLEIVTLNARSPSSQFVDFLCTQRQGFGQNEPVTATEEEAEACRSGFSSGKGAFLAYLNGEPVGTAGFSGPDDGLTEIAGIATLEPCRRRGIASALTARALELAFERGVEAAILSAGDERAGRVYERVGFRPFATMLAYRA